MGDRRLKRLDTLGVQIQNKSDLTVHPGNRRERRRLSGFLKGGQTMDNAPRDGSRFKAQDEAGNLRECWWGKTSHVPLHGWCWNDGNPEDADLWNPIVWWAR